VFIATVSPHNPKLRRSKMLYMSPLTGLKIGEQTATINIPSLTELLRHALMDGLCPYHKIFMDELCSSHGV